MKIDINKKNIFVDKFIEKYLDSGFGSMSKRDIDVLVMHLLMEHTNLNGENNFNLVGNNSPTPGSIHIALKQ